MFRCMMRFGPVMEFENKEAMEDFVRGFSLGKPYDIAMIQNDAVGTVYLNGAAVGVVVQDLNVEDLSLRR